MTSIYVLGKCYKGVMRYNRPDLQRDYDHTDTATAETEYAMLQQT